MNASITLRERIHAVVIGASAGGVDALTILLPALPKDATAAVFIALHLPRERPSLLVEIFAPKCALPVREAEDKETIQGGTVYFAPPDYHLLIEEGLPASAGAQSTAARQISLSVDDLVHFSRPSIDVLFDSAADVYAENLLGIILTGANEDGAEGLATVHERGGVTVVQRPEGAQASRMIESALARSAVDHVLSLEQIASLLKTLGTGSPPVAHRESRTP